MADATVGGVATTFIYITFNKLIQSAGTYAGGVFTVSSDWQVLDNTNVETWNGFNLGVTVNKFVKGKTYLIPSGQFAPLNMIPNFLNVLRAGSGLTFAATTFMYQAGEDTNILNDVDIANCITVDYLGAVALQHAEVKAVNKKREHMQLMLANGVPAQIVQLIANPAGATQNQPRTNQMLLTRS